MTGQDEPRAGVGFKLYGPQYARFASPLAVEMRREVYGEDIGQQGWRTATDATFAVLDCGGRLPFDDGTFDAILCIDAIPHFPNRAGTLLEWARLLRLGGRVVFTGSRRVAGTTSDLLLGRGGK
jgi:SAM-dependent methyltransferase